MIIWINGAFGSGKTSAAYELNRRLPGSFVYDPENVGYFIRRNSPEAFSHGDFQDIPLWREINYETIKMIMLGNAAATPYAGTLIVPMTLVNPGYYDEIIGKLRGDGIVVRHFILYASKDTILRRLRFRASRLIGGDAFAVNSVDRCIHAFDNLITEEKIHTDSISIDETVSEIARRCGISLQHDNKTRLGRFIHRMIVLARHIR